MELKRITPASLEVMWQVGFSQIAPEWKQYDGPYFNDYVPMSWETFREKKAAVYVDQEDVYGIFVETQLIGMVTWHWEYEPTRWVEVGIVIFEPKYWSGGYGTQALTQWVSYVFDLLPQVERVGLTTWSGNHRMMGLAQKIGMREEARIRKVRYWQGVYYDTMKYGVLREEWAAQDNT